MDKNDVKTRFESFSAGIMSENKIIVDKETGIEYLFHAEGYAGGLTVLLDRDGKPKINRGYQ